MMKYTLVAVLESPSGLERTFEWHDTFASDEEAAKIARGWAVECKCETEEPRTQIIDWYAVDEYGDKHRRF